MTKRTFNMAFGNCDRCKNLKTVFQWKFHISCEDVDTDTFISKACFRERKNLNKTIQLLLRSIFLRSVINRVQIIFLQSNRSTQARQQNNRQRLILF